MAVDTPLAAPEAYDSIVIDGIATPGVCTLQGGGDRKLKIEAQQAPGFGGAFTICRGEEVPTIDYEVRVWAEDGEDDVMYKALQALAARLRAAQKPRPPKVLSLVDLCIAHNEIAQVVVASVGAIKVPKDGSHVYTLAFSFSEWRKRRPIGGVPKQPKTSVEIEIERLNAENAALDQQLQAAQLAASRGI